ncbi:MAG: hypothetical protein GXO25_05680 [Euryarchaeota archaeon]|nr:hypothetical protein [Euryarchaeota archaeon]
MKSSKKLAHAIEKEKKRLLSEFESGKLSVHQLAEGIRDIEYVEEYLSKEPAAQEFMDMREIRELAGKTLYISLPPRVKAYGWDKGIEVKMYITENGEKIILQKVKK